MKMKSIAMLAMSGLLAASIAYTVPAMAEEENLGQLPSDIGMTEDSGTQTSANSAADTTAATSDTAASPGEDGAAAGTPDTATGDDDY